MKIVPPKPFTFEAGKRGVLLLHGFTGNSSDVRILGRFLQDKGYTTHAPHYKGHGVPPEELVHTGPKDWWEDVKEGYEHLKSLGCDDIAIVGLSLGGVFTIKSGYTFPVKGLVTMCAPMNAKTEDKMYQGVLEYAKEYKKYEGKSKQEIESEMDSFKKTPMNTLEELGELIENVRKHVDMIYAPILVVQARNDEMIDTESANIIYNEVQSSDKTMKWYENSTHVITIGEEKDQLNQDIFTFLEGLDWTDSH